MIDPTPGDPTFAFVLQRLLGLFGLITVTLVAEPLVVLVSIDGCRWDYPELHDAPTLQSIAAEGFRVERLVPSFPTKTFPNHYTLVTGLRPETHGIIQNKFWDDEFEAWFGIGAHPAAREGRWWGGEPIWITAQQQGLRTAAFFWPGTEADIQGRRPDKWMKYDKKVPDGDRVNQVLAWSNLPDTERPHLVFLYFERVDTAGHHYGPESPQTKTALHHVDQALAQLRQGLIDQGRWDSTHLLITSDHGMTTISPDQTIPLGELIDLDKVQVVFNGANGGLNAVDAAAIPDLVEALNRHPQLRAYARADVPARLHYSNNDRIPDIILIPHLGWKTSLHPAPAESDDRGGDHGFDNIEADMASIMIAHGPRFRAGTKISETSNVDVYNLLCELLGITPAPNEGGQTLVEQTN